MADQKETLRPVILNELQQIKRSDWNALNRLNNPFLDYDFLNGLEKFGCLQDQAWLPCHHLLYRGETLIAAVPAYLKHDSYGEFVFDWAWADAYERHGKAYYPKLVSAIPFTPVSGERLLINPDEEYPEEVTETLLSFFIQTASEKSLSSAHILFCREEDSLPAGKQDMLQRRNWQYQWFNQDYTSFDDYLKALNSKRRKQIRRERRSIQESGLKIERLQGNDISEQHWACFYEFYCSTFERKWGEPRFNLDFLNSLMTNLAEHCLLIMAKHENKYVAGAFAMQDGDCLHGRHWGCNDYFPNLHFELCYYQTIEYCIEQGIQRLDAGIQGEHKIFRGFQPVAAHSLHWIADKAFRRAIGDFLKRETEQVNEQINLLNQHIPYTI